MEIITLSHGSGGKVTNGLIENLFYKYFNNEFLLQKNDSTVVPMLDGRLAVTTDSFVVNPIFFNGGDIGKLAVCGTVNDLAMSGAKPLYITVGFILEEGLTIEELKKIVISMAETAKEAGVQIVAGDTKVVERGSGDKIFINTTGIGVVKGESKIGGSMAEAGDKVIVSGTLGDHGMCIMAQRENLEFEMSVPSDCGLLHGMIADITEVSSGIKVLRDPTRGGVAATLNEIADHSGKSIILDEASIPVKEEVQAICEMLGFDPMYVANEGKLLVIVKNEDAEAVLEVMSKHSMGVDAKIIGEVLDKGNHSVMMKTEIGGTRVVHMPLGELLPRIC